MRESSNRSFSPAWRERRHYLFSVLLTAILSLAVQSGAPLDRTLCHDCFWQFQTPALKKEVIASYRAMKCRDDFCRAEVSFLLGNVTNDSKLLRDAVSLYANATAHESDPRRKLLLEMILGVTGARSGVSEKAHLTTAAQLAMQQGRPTAAALLSDMVANTPPRFGDAPIRTKLVVPPGAKFFILGESTIRVPQGARVAVQLERTYRDWLSHQFDFDFRDGSLGTDYVLNYHEGARLRDIITLAHARTVPVVGTIVARKGNKWFGPDETGVFRYEILDDKIEYPTTKRRGDYALITDTHGISALVEQSAAGNVDLVLGCGDNPGKMQAAFHLAESGINVYFPCDRQVAMLLGYDAPGVLLGTAPVHVEKGDVVIGDQPVKFKIGEKIVVTDIKADSVARYYDSGARYFRTLSQSVPLQIFPVYVGVKEDAKAVAEAKRVGADVLGIRVRYQEDYVPVRAWLAESPNHRVVLFHSAPYEPGNRLFSEFPAQVTFGDPHPRFE